MKKFDVTNITEVKDFDDVNVLEVVENQFKKPFCKFLGNHLNKKSLDFELADKARMIYDNKEVEFTSEEEKIFVNVIKEIGFLPIIERTIFANLK